MHLLVQHDDTLAGAPRLSRHDRVYVVTDDGNRIDISQLVKRVRLNLEANGVVTCDLLILRLQLEGITEEVRREIEALEQA